MTEQQVAPAEVGLSAETIWRALRRGSFAVLGFVNPRGEPRTSGVMYLVDDRRLFVAVDSNSWKARYIHTGDEISVTATVHRGGPLALVFPIPPATVTFRALATVYPASAPQRPLPAKLARRLPPERRTDVTMLELLPVGTFVTYGVGVSLRRMADPSASRARVAVS